MDELEELRRSNPVSIEDAARLVTLKHDDVVEALVMSDNALPPQWNHRDASAGRGTNQSERSRGSRVLVAAAAALVALAAGVVVVDQQGAETTVSTLVASPIKPATLVTSTSDWTFDRKTDLLAVHLDWADAADAHAAVAVREATAWFGLDPVVVAEPRSADVDEVDGLMDLIWGSAWLDAASTRQEALDAATVRWLAALDAGGRVFVAEGGAGPFTAEVVRQIERLRPSLETKRLIRVVHGPGFDASKTTSGSFLERSTTLVEVDAASGAQLRGASEAFESTMLAGTHAASWTAAFDFLPAEQLDLSETALILQILSVTTSQIATPSDFAAFFVGDQPDMAFRGDS